MLAVLARKAGQFAPEHVTLLEILGRQAVTRLELYNRVRLQEQAQRQRQRTERALAIERMFCGGDAGFDSGAGGGSGYGRAHCAHERCLHATDGFEPGRYGGATVCGRISRPWTIACGRQGSCARRRKGRLGTARNVVADGARAGASRELDAAAVAGTEWRDPVSDCERPGRDRPAGDGKGAVDRARRAIAKSVENSLGFVFTCSMEGRLTSLNAFTAETLGYRAEALVGR